MTEKENMAQEVEKKEPAASDCRFCKRPSQCPKCKEELDLEKPGEKTDIDGKVVDIYKQLPPFPEPLPPVHPQNYHCMPPEAPIFQEFSVFFAGSIEMGKAIQWQQQLAVHLQDLPISMYNPRRGKWDPKATQDAKNEAFRHQVEWELDALQKAKVICFFFDWTTMSPVTLCELGLWAHSAKVVVCCDRRYWKGGNVHLVCERYGIPLVEKFTDLEVLIRAMLGQKGLKVDGLPSEEVLKAAGQKAPKLKTAELGTA